MKQSRNYPPLYLTGACVFTLGIIQSIVCSSVFYSVQFPKQSYRLNEPNGVPWTSNATLHAVLIWMQAKLSCLDIQSNVVCYVHLDASQIELVGHP